MDSLEKRVQDQVKQPGFPALVEIYFDAYPNKPQYTWRVKCVVGMKGTRKQWGNFNGCTLSEALRNALPENREDKP